MMLVLVLGTVITFSSCSDDDETVGGVSIIGMWKASYGSSENVIEFIDGNSMYNYGGVTRNKNGWSGRTTEEVPGHTGWYYLPANKHIHTYYIVDNKIFVANGDIYTVMDNRIYSEGNYSDYYFIRW